MVGVQVWDSIVGCELPGAGWCSWPDISLPPPHWWCGHVVRGDMMVWCGGVVVVVWWRDGVVVWWLVVVLGGFGGVGCISNGTQPDLPW
jgi:hypothetical protein